MTHIPNVEKIARLMTAWRYTEDELPADVAQWLHPLPNGYAVLVSPRAGTAHGPGSRAGIVIEPGWWIIQTEVGCLYAVTHDEFCRKYRFLVPPSSPNTPLPFVFPGYHLGGTLQ